MQEKVEAALVAAREVLEAAGVVAEWDQGGDVLVLVTDVPAGGAA